MTTRPSQPREERRSFSGSISIEAELGGSDVPARAVDLSCGGCFLVASLEVSVGEVIVLTLGLDEAPLRVFGRVAHARVVKDGRGYGIEFLDLAPAEKDALRSVCSKLPPQVPKASPPKASPPKASAPRSRTSRPPQAVLTQRKSKGASVPPPTPPAAKKSARAK